MIGCAQIDSVVRVLMTKSQVRISIASIWKALDATRPSVAPEERKRLERMWVAFALSRS